MCFSKSMSVHLRLTAADSLTPPVRDMNPTAAQFRHSLKSDDLPAHYIPPKRSRGLPR